MNNQLKTFFIVVCAVAAMSMGCSKKPTAANITEWGVYQDPYFKVNFSYPTGWHVVSEGGKVSLFSTQGAVQKFFDPMSKAEEGAQLVVMYEKMDSVKTLEAYVDELKNDLTSAGFVIKSTEPAALEGTPAMKISYSGKFDADTKLESTRIISMKDSVVYTATYAGFNDFYTSYTAVLDSFVASARLPKPKTATASADPSIPSAEFEKFSNVVLDISYPNNFEVSVPQPKGEVQFSLLVQGYRQDSNILLDVRPAKGLSVEKVVEQNAKFFKPTSKGETTIEGMKTPFLNYSLARGTESRVYFIVKNDKVYRVIFNYYQPAKKDFLPVFEKVVASLHIK